jgi:prevent-host-death family protein
MDRINANDFRTNMKEWMEAARAEPIKITRKTGEAFVLISADVFEKMRLDLARLNGLTAGLMDIAQGRVNPSIPQSTANALARAKSRAIAGRKTKKAAGD